MSPRTRPLRNSQARNRPSRNRPSRNRGNRFLLVLCSGGVKRAMYLASVLACTATMIYGGAALGANTALSQEVESPKELLGELEVPYVSVEQAKEAGVVAAEQPLPEPVLVENGASETPPEDDPSDGTIMGNEDWQNDETQDEPDSSTDGGEDPQSPEEEFARVDQDAGSSSGDPEQPEPAPESPEGSSPGGSSSVEPSPEGSVTEEPGAGEYAPLPGSSGRVAGEAPTPPVSTDDSTGGAEVDGSSDAAPEESQDTPSDEVGGPEGLPDTKPESGPAGEETADDRAQPPTASNPSDELEQTAAPDTTTVPEDETAPTNTEASTEAPESTDLPDDTLAPDDAITSDAPGAPEPGSEEVPVTTPEQESTGAEPGNTAEVTNPGNVSRDSVAEPEATTGATIESTPSDGEEESSDDANDTASTGESVQGEGPEAEDPDSTTGERSEPQNQRTGETVEDAPGPSGDEATTTSEQRPEEDLDPAEPAVEQTAGEDAGEDGREVPGTVDTSPQYTTETPLDVTEDAPSAPNSERDSKEATGTTEAPLETGEDIQVATSDQQETEEVVTEKQAPADSPSGKPTGIGEPPDNEPSDNPNFDVENGPAVLGPSSSPDIAEEADPEPQTQSGNEQGKISATDGKGSEDTSANDTAEQTVAEEPEGSPEGGPETGTPDDETTAQEPSGEGSYREMPPGAPDDARQGETGPPQSEKTVTETTGEPADTDEAAEQSATGVPAEQGGDRGLEQTSEDSGPALEDAPTGQVTAESTAEVNQPDAQSTPEDVEKSMPEEDTPEKLESRQEGSTGQTSRVRQTQPGDEVAGEGATVSGATVQQSSNDVNSEQSIQVNQPASENTTAPESSGRQEEAAGEPPAAAENSTEQAGSTSEETSTGLGTADQATQTATTTKWKPGGTTDGPSPDRTAEENGSPAGTTSAGPTFEPRVVPLQPAEPADSQGSTQGGEQTAQVYQTRQWLPGGSDGDSRASQEPQTTTIQAPENGRKVQGQKARESKAPAYEPRKWLPFSGTTVSDEDGQEEPANEKTTAPADPNAEEEDGFLFGLFAATPSEEIGDSESPVGDRTTEAHPENEGSNGGSSDVGNNSEGSLDGVEKPDDSDEQSANSGKKDPTPEGSEEGSEGHSSGKENSGKENSEEAANQSRLGPSVSPASAGDPASKEKS